jgi:zinc transporter
VQLPEAFGDTLREGSRSTGITHVHQTLIAILKDVEYDLEQKTSLKVATLWVNVGVHCLISVRSPRCVQSIN